MALSTYDGLKTEIGLWVARTDLTSAYDTFIDLFEAWANRNLRVRQMEAEATATEAEYLPLPDDYVALRDVQVQSSPRRQLQYVTPEYADRIDADGTAGDSMYYTIVGNQLRLIPAPSGASDVRISYWQQVPALSDSNTSNWLLLTYPDAYLYGSLMHARAYIPDPAMSEHIRSGWQQAMAEVQAAGNRSNLGGSLQIRAL